MRKILSAFISLSILSLSACTEPGETTGIGAAAGGVVGASLGAIVGSATGDAGTGLVLGAVAGSATGAAVGNVLEAQQETIRTQDEAIERHERMIAAQSNEIKELRHIGGDSISMQREADTTGSRSARSAEAMGSLRRSGQAQREDFESKSQAQVVRIESATRSVSNKSSESPRVASSAVRETNLVDSPAVNSLRSSFNSSNGRISQPHMEQKQVSPSGVMPEMQRSAADVTGSSVGAIVAESGSLGSSPECVQAGGEFEKAQSSTELADKLFHLRRALRLCPDNASYHNRLGEVYMALNRRADAEFEFREALRQQPNLASAQGNLKALK